ncbi:hypothetical protein X777_05676 [Ooceraea biroi]|uniref:Uncharacterized protein n=1 Tax=Ooceraea biroi TaxID=2015173 RepID=A0A026WFI6_OOCBI|nr:hypothetical protein X777_05676 [Ooceraea biroi]
MVRAALRKQILKLKPYLKAYPIRVQWTYRRTPSRVTGNPCKVIGTNKIIEQKKQRALTLSIFLHTFCQIYRQCDATQNGPKNVSLFRQILVYKKKSCSIF